MRPPVWSEAETMNVNISVIKLGGSLLDDEMLRASALRKIAARWNSGESLILVHGGGKHIDSALTRAGLTKKSYAGLRITDDATLDIVVSVLGGSVNKMLVSELTRHGVPAAGISGCDATTLRAVRHEAIDGVDLGHVGRVTGSNRSLVRLMLTSGTLPVISSIAQSDDGALLNVNADSAASAIAIAHAAQELVFLTDVPGLLDPSGTVVEALDTGGIERMLASPAVSGGMKPKLTAALEALRNGVTNVTIASPAADEQILIRGGTTLVAA